MNRTTRHAETSIPVPIDIRTRARQLGTAKAVAIAYGISKQTAYALLEAGGVVQKSVIDRLMSTMKPENDT